MTDDFQIRDGVLTAYVGEGEAAVIPPGVTALGDECFAGAETLRRAVVPEGVTVFGEECFAGCTALESVTLPASLGTVGVAAFVSCAALRRIALPEGVERIGEGAFLYCAALRSIALPASLRGIGDMAFFGSGLESVSVPAGVREIGESAFWDCEALRRAEVLNPAAVLHENAFGSCYALTEGYMAPGYPPAADAAAELLYTLLWCGCPERHTAATASRAEAFIRANQSLIMERILKYNNVAALTGLVRRGLLGPERRDDYVRQAALAGQTELTALLLRSGTQGRNWEEDFAL